MHHKIMKNKIVSISPTGESFPLPTPEEYAAEFVRLQKLVAEQRKAGREIVVVVGLGFVGAVMAAVIADSAGKICHRHAAPQHPELLEDCPV